MAATRTLLTVAEFGRLPQPAGGVRQELHHGELIELAPVKKLHTKLQKRLITLLEAALNKDEYGVDKEFPFRPAAEHEVWLADVALFSLALWEQTPDDDYFRGVPAIVIEVLSPSNSTSEMQARQEVCLRNGGLEFWLVDPHSHSIKRVVQASGHTTLYAPGSIIDSSLLLSPIAVSDVFAH